MMETEIHLKLTLLEEPFVPACLVSQSWPWPPVWSCVSELVSEAFLWWQFCPRRQLHGSLGEVWGDGGHTLSRKPSSLAFGDFLLAHAPVTLVRLQSVPECGCRESLRCHPLYSSPWQCCIWSSVQPGPALLSHLNSSQQMPSRTDVGALLGLK